MRRKTKGKKNDTGIVRLVAETRKEVTWEFMNRNMWIRELPKDYYDHISWVKYSNMLWQNGKVYVMDNHLSAMWCWLNTCEPSEKYNFMHIDQHYDLLDSYYSRDIQSFKKRPLLSYDEFANLKRSESNTRYKVIQYDNYIVPTYELYPSWFSSSIFLTQRNGSRKGGWGHDYPQNIHEEDLLFLDKNIEYYLDPSFECKFGMDEDNNSLRWIINIDLDAFITKNEPHVQLFSDDYIRHISSIIQSKMSYIKVITIALSPDFMPGEDYKEKWDNAFRILEIMAEEIDMLKDFPLPKNCISHCPSTH